METAARDYDTPRVSRFSARVVPSPTSPYVSLSERSRVTTRSGGSENDERTRVSAADVATCDAPPPDLGDCAEGKRAFDCPESVNLEGKCDYAGEWAIEGSNEPSRSGSTWCCAL